MLSSNRYYAREDAVHINLIPILMAVLNGERMKHLSFPMSNDVLFRIWSATVFNSSAQPDETENGVNAKQHLPVHSR